MSGHCATCRRWDGSDDANPEVRDERFGICRAIEHENYDGAAYVQDYEGYAAKLYTRAEFGCVLHAPRA